MYFELWKFTEYILKENGLTSENTTLTLFGESESFKKQAACSGYEVYTYNKKEGSFKRACNSDAFISLIPKGNHSLDSIFATIHNLRSKTGKPLIFIDGKGIISNPIRFYEKGWIYKCFTL
jgi:hypothetical protein